MVTLVSEVASAYVQLRWAQQEVAIGNKNLEDQGTSLNLTRRRFEAGADNALAVAQAESQVANTTATIPAYESQVRQQIFIISVLLG